MEDWPVKGPFDAIFCRNVVIYFDKQTQARIFTRLGKVLASDGYHVCGAFRERRPTPRARSSWSARRSTR